MSSLDDNTADQPPPDRSRRSGVTAVIVVLALLGAIIMLSPRTPLDNDRGMGPRPATESPGPIPSTERRPKPDPG